MHQPSQPQPTTFRPKVRWFSIVFGVFCLVVAILFIWGEVMYIAAGSAANLASLAKNHPLLGEPDGLSQAKYLFRLIVFFPFFIYYSIRNLHQIIHKTFCARLVLAPEGITYHAFGYTLTAHWADVEKTYENRILFSTVKGLLLRPGVDVKKWRWYPLGDVKNRKFAIPLSDFNPDAAQGNLYDLVDQYLHPQNASGDER